MKPLFFLLILFALLLSACGNTGKDGIYGNLSGTGLTALEQNVNKVDVVAYMSRLYINHEDTYVIRFKKSNGEPVNNVSNFSFIDAPSTAEHEINYNNNDVLLHLDGYENGDMLKFNVAIS